MKISLVSTDFYPNIGGVAQHVLQLGKALRESGHPVEVIAPSYSQGWADFFRPPCQEFIDELPVWRIPLVLDRRIRFVSGQISSRISDARLNHHVSMRLGEFKPDIVHWHAWESRSQPLKKWTSSARVWTNHTSMFLDRFAQATEHAGLLDEIGFADEIIAPSQELADLTVQLGVPKEQVHFIPNGVDSRQFHPQADSRRWRERLKLKSNETMVLCPRRLEKKNGVGFFVEAAGILIQKGMENVRFVVAGDFSSNPRLSAEAEVREKASRLGKDRIQLIGKVENFDMPGLYALSSLVIIPSLQEATSISTLEAMACGKPVVATEVGGLPFLVHPHENGLLVPPSQAQALADAMVLLLKDEKQCRSMGESGRRRIMEELDWKRIAAKTQEVYQRACSKFHKNHP